MLDLNSCLKDNCKIVNPTPLPTDLRNSYDGQCYSIGFIGVYSIDQHVLFVHKVTEINGDINTTPLKR